jgi:hypothetical protein
MSNRAENIFGWFLAALWLLICIAILSIPFMLSARADDDHKHHWHPKAHEVLHDRFYSKWNIPPSRSVSCCGLQDCYPTQVKIVGDRCWAQRFPGSWDTKQTHMHEWVAFPCSKLEENQDAATQPHDSPDGQSHACISKHHDHVYCAVRGSGA